MHHSTGRSNSSTFKPNAALNDDWSQVSDPIERRRMQNELRNEGIVSLSLAHTQAPCS